MVVCHHYFLSEVVLGSYHEVNYVEVAYFCATSFRYQYLDNNIIYPDIAKIGYI